MNLITKLDDERMEDIADGDPAWHLSRLFRDSLRAVISERDAALSRASSAESALAELRGRINVEGIELVILGCPDKPFFGGSKTIARALRDHLTGKEKG
jgi:hypothetical protein